MDNSDVARTIGTVIGGLLCSFGSLFALVAIVLACIKRTKGWIITAIVFSLMGFTGLVAVGVIAFREIQAEAKGQRKFKTMVSKDGWISLRVPTNWQELDELHADAILKAGNKFSEEYLAVLSDSRADYTGTLEEFAKLTTKRMRDNLSGGTMSESQSLTINGYRALRTTIEGSADNVRICYLHTSVETPDGLHQILQWTLPSKRAKVFPTFEQVDVTFTVVKPREETARKSAPASRRSGSVEQRVKAIIAEQFGLNPNEVQSAYRLTTDLGADELDVVELVMAVEEEFNVEIPDEEASKFSRVSDIVKFVTRRKEPSETL